MSELESRRDEQEKNEWMESYLKSKGLLNLVDVATMDMPSEASSTDDLEKIKKLTEEINSNTNMVTKPVIQKMIKHNSDTKKKKLIESVKQSEKVEWIPPRKKRGRKSSWILSH